MDALVLSFHVVLPLFFMMALGYFVRCINLVDEKSFKVMNNLVFRVFLPLMLFSNIYHTHTQIEGKLIAFAVIAVLSLFIILCCMIPLIEKDNRKRGVMIQGIMRSNFVIFGLPVAISVFGEENAGVPSMMIAVVIPMFNILSVLVLELYRGGRIDFRRIIRGLVTNPLIIASVLGLTMMGFHITLPYVVDKTITDLAGIATPLALIILGGSIHFDKVKQNLRQLAVTLTGRLVIVPLILVPIAAIMGFRGVELLSVFIMAGAPTAVSSFTMAEQMEADGELAGQIVVFGSTFCIITIFLWIFCLKQIGLI